jgi:hypothetical protein
MANLKYTVKNPDKYIGNPHSVYARSRWEIYYMTVLDNSSMVIKWTSEPKYLNIRYLDPTAGIDIRTGKRVPKKNGTSVYWPDFIVQYADGTVEIVEIKPMKEARQSAATTMYDKLLLVKNMAKWAAADRFAKSIGARFKVLTEEHLFGSTGGSKRKTTRQTVPTVKPIKTKRTTRGTRK